MLQSKFLNLELEHFCFKPEIDLFATNINTQFGKNAAFRSDLGAIYIDAFSIDWSDWTVCTLPPISVIPRVIHQANHCQEMLLKSYQLRGEWEQGKGTVPISKGLSSFVVKGTLIPFKQPLWWEQNS